MNSATKLLLVASLALAFFPYPAIATAARNAPSANASAETPASTIAPSFQNIRLIPAAKQPAACDAALFGSFATRAPDGALCLCHQSYDGKHGLWEQLGTGKACWTDAK
jgi:hypothetical protein